MNLNQKTIITLRTMFSGLFCLLLISPIIQGVFGIVDLPGVQENRRLAALSDVTEASFNTFPARVDSFLNDNYGFRRFMIKVANSIRFHVFRINRLGNVIVGKDGWLFFYSDTDGNTIADYKKTNRFTRPQLINFAYMLTEREKNLSSRGIKLFIVLVPNKGAVYSEYLPSHLQIEGESLYDQVSSFLRYNTGLNVIDLKAELLRAKDDYNVLLYEPNGSHWNTLGAFVGYRAIMERLQRIYPDLNLRNLSDYEVRHAKDKHDLEDMLGVFGYESPVQPSLYLNGKKVKPHIFGTDHPLDGTILAPGVSKTGSLPRAVIFRDSYFNTMQPFMEDHFSYAFLYRWHDGILYNATRFDEIIAWHQPQIVIVEVVERALHRLSFFAR